MKIKKLKLDRWMRLNPEGRPFLDCVENEYELIDPIIGKPGRYLQNGVEWFETKKVAYRAKNGDDFQYDLDHLEVQRLNSQQISALREVIKQKVATEGQRKTVRMYDQALQCRNVGRNARMWRMRILGK